MSRSGLDGLVSKLENVKYDTHSLSRDECHKLVTAFCRVTPPKVQKTPRIPNTTELIILSSGGLRGGTSVKPGNITLNWKNLFSALPGMVLTGVSVAAHPWLIVLGALVICIDLNAKAKVKLDPHHAIAMLAMWENHNGRRQISESTARQLTNKALVKFDMNELSERTFAKVVEELCEIKCIELIEGEILLRETISKKWS
tara:strand:- start:97 stop:696 length:600 start_codon:yes stop_codon:yes gene_type:complete